MLVLSENDLTGLKKIGEIVALARDEMLKAVKVGITTLELDKIGEDILNKHGAKSAPKYEYGFPGATCISINDVAAHGIPNSIPLKEGDTVNIDVSASLNGYFADTGATIGVGKISMEKEQLLTCSKAALKKAINIAKDGVKINQLGKIVYDEAKENSFTVIKNLTGHGIGRMLHDSPECILNYYEPKDKRVLKEGMALALETFISTKAEFTIEQDDNWTLKTPDGSFVAQFEHTIIVTKDKPIILTL